jgi:hypothetical protein
MVRKKQKEPRVDTELVYAYAKVGQMGQLEEFISGTHQANLQACGDRSVLGWKGVKQALPYYCSDLNYSSEKHKQVL